MKGILAIIILSFSVCLCFGKKLPSFVNKCKLKDPNLSDCMKNAIQDFSKYLPKGVQSMKIPSLNPYTVSEIKYEVSWMNGTFTNFQVYDVYNYIVDYVNVDFDKGIMQTMLKIDTVNMKSHYILDGKLIQITIHGEGEAEARLKDTVTNSTIYGKKVTRHGSEYFSVQKGTFNFVNKNLDHVYFGNLVEGNLELTKHLNTALLENREEVFKELFPIFEEIINKILVSIYKGVFDNFSLNDLYD